MTVARMVWPHDRDKMPNRAAVVFLEIEAEVREHGLPRPCAARVVPYRRPPVVALYFTMNDTEAVDAWAKHVGAKVGFTDWTWGDVDHEGRKVGAPCHEYGTAAEGSRYGAWRGYEVLLICTVLGPHTISQPSSPERG